ncbi:MAG: hypothetical protein RIC35_06120 [Marinoscillum sp.]
MERKYSSYWKIKSFILLIMILQTFHPQVAFGQNEAFINEYLLGATEDARVIQRQEESQFLENDPIKSSWIRETEIRMRTNQDRNSFDDYRFRLTPSNPWEVRANKAYHNQLSETTNISYQVALSKSLRNRYLNLTESYFLTKKSEILDRKIDLKTVRSEQMLNFTSKLDGDNLLEIESDLSNLEIEKAELDIKLLEVDHNITKYIKSSITWSNKALIDPPYIASLIVSNDTSITRNIYKELVTRELDLENSMYKVSKAKAFSNIGFLQADMDFDQGDSFDDHLGFQVGVTIPIVNKDKADLARDRFELIEKKNEAQRSKTEVDQEVEILLKRIQSLIKMYDLLEEKLDRSEQMVESMTEDPGESTLFKHRNYQLNLVLKKLDIHERLIKSYIDYLDIHGLLVAEPMVNYLSNDLSVIR